MHRGGNNHIAFRCIALTLACLVLSGVAACQSENVTDPPGFHLLLRLEGGKTTYKLGEAINLEVACNSDQPQQFTSGCGDSFAFTGFEVVPLDSKAKVALDRVETNWIGRTLCAFAQYQIDTLTGEGSLPVVGVEVHWRKWTLSEHYPMSPGRFRIRLGTRGALLPSTDVFTASSAPVEITVVDDPQWRVATLRQAMQAVKALDPAAPDAASAAEYAKVQYMPDLKALHWLISENGYESHWENHPNRAAVVKFLREYFDTKSWHKEAVEAVLALELAAESPALYARAVRFQDALGKPSRNDLRDLRAWLLPCYRRLMLEVARSMVTTHKRFPDRYLEYTAEELVRLNVPECYEIPNFLSERELQHYMQEAGLTSKFIDEQIAGMRRARMKLSPYTKNQHRAVGFWRVIETPPQGVSVKWLVIGLGDSQAEMKVTWPIGVGCQTEEAEILGNTITTVGGHLQAVIQIRGPKKATLSLDGGRAILHMRKTKEATNFGCE